MFTSPFFSFHRTLSVLWHIMAGWGMMLAVVAIGIGTTLLPNVDDQKAYQMAYGIGVGILLFSLIAFGIYDKKNYPE